MSRYRPALRFKPSLREQMRRNALSTLAQSDPAQRQAKLDDPAVHERVKQSIREQMQREAEALAYVPRTRTRRGPTPETNVNSAIKDAVPLVPGLELWRNNRGVAWRQGQNGKSYPVKYGVGPNGAADWLGYRSVTITAEMVGQRVAVFVAVEAKADGEPSEDQENFLQRVRDAGGTGIVARSGEDVTERLR